MTSILLANDKPDARRPMPNLPSSVSESRSRPVSAGTSDLVSSNLLIPLPLSTMITLRSSLRSLDLVGFSLK